MRCPRCQNESPAGSSFCLECGARLGLTCTSCGMDLPAGSKFCNKCGTAVSSPAAVQPRFTSPESYTPKHLAEKILTSKSALEGERKQVTVLFADLKGSMELLADRDPEEARKILDPVLERMMEAVHRYEGTVNQVMGDGIMALFGAPLAHEDHAVRACYAALRMQDSVKRYAEGVQRASGVPLQIRVGLNSGEVVVRSIGSDLHMDYTAVGQTTHLAARMEQMAMAGSILITAGTLGLAEGYVEVEPLGPVSIKGLPLPVEAYEVRGAGRVRTRLQASAARGLSRFVGRDAEMEQLRVAQEQVAAGHGQVVSVVGEPGVGKSRLFYEFIHSHRTRGWLVLESASVSYGRATAYLPVIDLLKSYFRIEPRDDARTIGEKVGGKVLMLDRTLEDTIPAVLALFDTLPEDSPFRALEPPDRRRRTLQAIKALFLRESGVQPLVLVFEDLHWIDSETQALLDSLLDSLPAVPILLLVNYRPEYRHGWGSRTCYHQLRIDALSGEGADELLLVLLGDDRSLEALKRLLLERTQGNPFFLEESVRGLLEVGALSGERGGHRLTRPVTALQVPVSVQALLAARIDRLAAVDKRLLETAAAIGKDVPYLLLAAVAAEEEGALQLRLGRLQGAEFLYETRLFPEAEYTFKHALTHEVVYAGLVQERRRVVHARIVEAIEQLYRDRLAEHYEELAHHSIRAEVGAKAMEYSVLAGRRAQDSFANTEAKAHYARALDTARKQGPVMEPALVAGLQDKYAGVLVVLGEYAAAVAEYEQALDLSQQSGNRALEASILSALSGAHQRDHNAEAALDYNERALMIAGALGDREMEARCLVQRAHVRAVWYGAVDEGVRDTEVALQLTRESAERPLRGQIFISLGQLRQWRGDYRRALGPLVEGLQTAESERDWQGVARATFFATTANAAVGEYEEALRYYRRLHDYAFDAQDNFWMSRTTNLAGGIHLELFDLDEAIRLNLEGHEVALKCYRWSEPRGHCLLKVGLAYLEMGDVGRATGFLDRTWALLDEDAFLRWRWQIPLLRARGALALAQGHLDEAWDYASQSLEMATRTASGRHEARAQHLQGRVLAASGRLEEAASTLAGSVALAASLGTPREVWLGRAALGRVLASLGRDREAETAFMDAAGAIETIVVKVTTPHLRRSLLTAEPVVEVYRSLGRPVPQATA